jgi:hypothetical protein
MSSEECPNRRRAIQTPLESSAWLAGGETQGRLHAYSMRSANQASPRESSHHAFTGRIQLTAVANHIGQEFGA